MITVGHFGAGHSINSVVQRYINGGYDPIVRRGEASVTFISPEQEPPAIIRDSDLPFGYIPSQEFWINHTGTFDRVVVAVEPQNIISLAEQITDHLQFHDLYLEKPPYVSAKDHPRIRELVRRAPGKIRQLSQYLFKSSLNHALSQLHLIGQIKRVSFWMRETKLITPSEVSAYEAGILRCFICHALMAIRKFIPRPFKILACRRGRYIGCPISVPDSYADILGITDDGVEILIVMGKAQNRDQKAIVIDGEWGRIAAFLKEPKIFIEILGEGPEVAHSDNNDNSYAMLAQAVVLQPWGLLA